MRDLEILSSSTFVQDVSLYDHNCQYNGIRNEILANLRPREGFCKYDSIRVPLTIVEDRREELPKFSSYGPPYRTKWTYILVDVNDVVVKVGCG